MHPRRGQVQPRGDVPDDRRPGRPAGARVRAGVQPAPRPATEPALLQHSDVETFFHEFGHLIHHVFAGDSRWSGISGIATEWDFVEAPSQLLEEWVRDAPTLATFAVHHETGEPLPAEMVAQAAGGRRVRQGPVRAAADVLRRRSACELYRRDPAGLDPVAVEREAQERLTPYRHVDGTYLHLGFGHLDGYSAIYYTYMWSLVIAKDLFTVFAREGLLDPATARPLPRDGAGARAARPRRPSWSRLPRPPVRLRRLPGLARRRLTEIAAKRSTASATRRASPSGARPDRSRRRCSRRHLSNRHHRGVAGDRLGHREDAPEGVGGDRRARLAIGQCRRLLARATCPARVTTSCHPASRPDIDISGKVLI